MMILAILFFVTSIVYASVGFGGGSTYLALLLIWGIPYSIFPLIALSCNIIVVSGNCFNYIRYGNLNLKLLIPYLAGSIPLAFIGGSLTVEKQLFEILLFLVLLIAGIFLLINFKSYDDNEENYRKIPFIISIFIGGITLTGSLVAFLKLQGIIRGAPLVFSGQHLLNAFVTFSIIVLGVMAINDAISISVAILIIIGLSLILGCLVVLPIGGADMPVVISLLNSFSGLAAATTGFVLVNNALIISGSLVGASGIILTNIMCKGMNRTIWNVLFSSVGTDDQITTESGGDPSRSVKSYEPEDTVVIFENASQVGISAGASTPAYIIDEVKQKDIKYK